jgi:polyisoprenoid-binding protein YceI
MGRTRCAERWRAALLAMLVCAGACAPGPREAPPSAVVPATPGATPSAAARYAVDPARTEIRILTFRAGPLARLGHSHVLLSRDVRGWIAVPDDPGAAAFELELPVAALAIDEPAARGEEGAEFASVPTPADVEGTRRNLLGPQVLDAAAFPRVRVLGAGATASGAEFVVHARIELRGRTTPLDVPVRVRRDARELVATGEFRVAQSALGLVPFSVALGALQVRDELVVRFRIVAARAG